ncbi:ATP-grasp ribosomal peptide maturase [Streptomyces litchfieldiae]|uniref:ATP-grasp ribosomal peptide maturase n=1 Tax=Streptomyces litchfieldiae TaxID=3075543 RepID=A0ABU2MZ60_9ACTN|nr:ATP-grasp ribosomal peptide maturase [Streptomyces sp. DSM 44938]MDT0345804.1 ATP-grasp ribosomal peptide maturase [Streptomyces sp. DSM 44938]
MTVLVLTRPVMDAVSDLVIEELNRRSVPVHRMDPGDFPESIAITARIGPDQRDWQGIWRGQHRDMNLQSVTAVYYRRPGPFRLHSGLSPGDAEWARAEARAGFSGVLSSLRCLWVNHPRHNAAAEVAPVALATALRCGLPVPATLITNDPLRAREFAGALPGRVAAYKPLDAAGPRAAEGEQQSVWTNKVRAEELTDDLALTAHLFQQWIDKQYEVRLTAVDGRMFAAEIHAGSEASRIDFRRDYASLTYRVCPVPANIARGVRELMRAFGLRYAALDFLVDDSDDWYLVDLNPNGQFGFISELRQPIAHALADVLEGATR